MSVWKQLLLILFLGAVGAGGYWAYDAYIRPAEAVVTNAGPPAITVGVAVAEQKTLARTVEAVGTTRARRSVRIVPVAAGRVTEIGFQPGQHVAAGDVLIRLDDEIERANLAEAEANLVEARQQVERVRQLQRSNAVAMAQLEQATARFAAAAAAADRAATRLADRRIRAPFDGVVGLTEIDPGARVEEGDVITTLDDLSEVEVAFSLPETLFAAIRVGQRVTATSAAFPDRGFAGRVSVIGTRVDQVSRAFPVRAVFPNPEGTLPAGMFMFLTLTLSERDSVTVPEEAVIAQAAGAHVYVVDNGQAERRRVATGQREAGIVAILDGVAAGEAVVIHGLERLNDGTAVDVLNAPAIAVGPPGEGASVSVLDEPATATGPANQDGT